MMYEIKNITESHLTVWLDGEALLIKRGETLKVDKMPSLGVEEFFSVKENKKNKNKTKK